MPGYGSKKRDKKKTYNGKSKKKQSNKKKFNVNYNKIKSNKLAKKYVKRQVGDEIKNIDPAKMKELHKIALKAIQKERLALMRSKVHSGLSSVEMRSPYRPLKATVQWDSVSSDTVVRAILEQYAMEFPFLDPTNQGIAPYQFRFYLVTLAICYIKKIGKLTGFFANFVPTLLETFVVPKPWAMYLQYLGVASNYGAQQTTEFTYNTDLVATTDAVGLGDGLNQADSTGTLTPISYAGQSSNLVLTASAVPAPSPNNDTTPVDQPNFILTIFSDPAEYQHLSTWMSTPGNMDFVSNVLQHFEVPCVPCKWLPGAFDGRGRAPDSSGYTFYNQATPILLSNIQSDVPVGACWLNVHKEYDPELAYLFSLGRVATTTPAVAAEPLPMPIYDYNLRYQGSAIPNAMPWYLQPIYVACWLANNCDELKRGHWKDLTVKGTKLSTFFPNPRAIGGTSFSTLVAHCYQEIQTLQANSTQQGTTGTTVTGGFLNDNNLGWNWWTLVTASTQALQRKFNLQQVVVANSPVMANPGQQLLLPQFNWVDSAASSVKLPAPISKAIEDFGCCIYKGRLYIPQNSLVNDSTEVPFPITGANSYGPIAWSAYGWLNTPLDVYPYENTMTPVTFQTTPTALNVKLDKLVINNAFAAAYTGWDNANFTLYPAFLGGQWIQKYMKLLTSFFLSGNNINTIEKNTEAPEETVLGDDTCLIPETIPNFKSIESEPINPNGLMSPGAPPFVQNNLIRIVTEGVTSQGLQSEEATGKTMVNGFVQDQNQPVSNNDTANRRSVLAIKNMARGLPQVTNNPISPMGMFNVTTRAGNSFTSYIAQLCHNTITPDSEFGKQKALVDKARNSLGQMIPKNKKALIEKITTKRAYATELSKLAPIAFGYLDRCPKISADAMNTKAVKGMPDSAVSTLAVVDSNSQITSSAGSAPQDKLDPKHRRLKLDGKRIKNVSKAVVDTAQKVGKGVDDAVKGVSHVMDMAGEGMKALGSIFV